MDILQVVPNFLPSIGGIETSVYYLVKGLREAGHDVTVMTSDIPPVGSYIVDGARIYRLPVLFKLYESPFCPSLVFMLGKEKADVIHAHMPPRFFADCVSTLHKLGFFGAAPLILSFHLYVENAPSLIRAISTFHYMTISRLMFRDCDRIIVPTESYRSFLMSRFNISSKKINVIPCGIDLDLFNPKKFEKGKAKKGLGKSSGKTVLFLGRLDVQGAEQKGLHYLLEAVPMVAKEFSDVKFVIAGGGERLRYFRDLCRKSGIVPYVEFMGKVPRSQIPMIFSIADVFVLPSLYESFGIVLCEAMAMKKPIVATRIRGIVDVVDDGKTGFLVEPKNSRELAHAILEILSDDALANRLGEAGRKSVEKKYDWNFVTQHTLQVYEECANGRR